jgi:hypothetical protein
MDNLLPIEAFVEAHVKCEWRTRETFTVYSSAESRFQIQHQHAEGMAFACWRQEALVEAGIYDYDGDAKEFAAKLMETFFMHTSPHQMCFIVAELQAYLAKWETDRAAFIDKNEAA